MKTPLDAPDKSRGRRTQKKNAPPHKSQPPKLIHTAKISAGKAAPLDIAESERDQLDDRGSVATNQLIVRN